jgi:diketogulonate reductase-like aldo/keto reductase
VLHKNPELEGYIDLYLIHAPYGSSADRLGQWRAMVEAQKAGKIRSLGVSNYGVHHLEELKKWQSDQEDGGVLSVGQWELHPWLPRKDIVDWCRREGVAVQAYSPLVRATRQQDPLLVPLVEKYKKTPAQVLLRWSLQMGFVPLPKSVHEERIRENADIFDFELTEEEVRALDTGRYEPCCWDPTKEKI